MVFTPVLINYTELEDAMKETIKHYITDKIIREDIDFDYNTSLFEEGIIDSLGQVKLISFLEKNFSIAIEPGEITTENFDTINQIASLVEQKLQK